MKNKNVRANAFRRQRVVLIQKLTPFHKCTRGRYFIASFEIPLVK